MNQTESTPPARALLACFRRSPAAAASLAVITILSVAALLAPAIAPYDYEQMFIELGATPPSSRHWLGTDIHGRDLFTRILYGGRVSLMVGLCATLVSLTIGVTYGAIAGYFGNRVDNVMMRIVDILYALPFTIFVIILTVLFGRHIVLLFIAIGAVEWLTMARIVRGEVLALKDREFMQAAISLASSRRTIMRRHILPNIIGPIIVYTTLMIPQVILLESFVSFLGLGVQPPESSWGLLIKHGADDMETYPWLLVFPGLTLSMALLSLNIIGDALRDALDPRQTRAAG